MELRPEVKKDFGLIMECFGGVDGGISFLKTRLLLEEFDKRATNGDEPAEQVVQIMRRFAHLIRQANSIQ